jgi:scyllo-inositol 2-dehydrogenase (NADP+)
MKAIIVGLGVQGLKRKNTLKKNELVGSVDPYKKNANYKSIREVSLSSYDTVFICTPENEKLKFIDFCLKNKKNFLIEKPFPILSLKKFYKLKLRIYKSNQVCYVAYNHRFEPYIIKLKNFLKIKKIGKIYSCKLFYGNGTSKLIKTSAWRNKEGMGVIQDLFPHLLDICDYLFDLKKLKFKSFVSNKKLFISNKYETLSPDHAIFNSKINNIFFQLEASYCMWKNKFYCEVIGEKGSLHLNSLCKWGRTTFKYRKRVLPSGVPIERAYFANMKDPTWKSEHVFFKNLILRRKKNNLERDFWINRNILKIKEMIK